METETYVVKKYAAKNFLDSVGRMWNKIGDKGSFTPDDVRCVAVPRGAACRRVLTAVRCRMRCVVLRCRSALCHGAARHRTAPHPV